MEDSVHKTKTQFPKLLAAAAPGGEVIVTSGRARKRIAEVSRMEGPNLPRIGVAKDILPTPLGPEFFDPLPEDEMRLWNGEGN